MANFFQLSNGVRVASNQPIDGDRYVVSDITERDSLITNDRAFNGLQVFVESSKVLYLLMDISVPTWIEINLSGSTPIYSDPTQILFNSGGTISGSSNLTYDYDNSVFKISNVKSDFSVNNSYDNNPTLSLKSNFIDGIEINVASNLQLGGVFSTITSNGSQLSKLNVGDNKSLFLYGHSGYYNNTDITVVEIEIKTVEAWTDNSYATSYSIKTVSSGNSDVLDERFLINGNGEIKFNNSYTFPITSGTNGQILTQSGNGYLYWNDSINTLSGLTDTIINSPQEGDKLIFSGGSWVNIIDSDYVYTENIGTGGDYDFSIVDNLDYKSLFIKFSISRVSGGTVIYQMGELQILQNNTVTQLTVVSQDINLNINFSSYIDGNNINLVCEVPSNLTTDTIMKYKIEKF